MPCIARAGSPIGAVVPLILWHEVPILRIAIAARQSVGDAVRMSPRVAFLEADLNCSIKGPAFGLSDCDLLEVRVRAAALRIVEVGIVAVAQPHQVAPAGPDRVGGHRERSVEMAETHARLFRIRRSDRVGKPSPVWRRDDSRPGPIRIWPEGVGITRLCYLRSKNLAAPERVDERLEQDCIVVHTVAAAD